MNTLEKFKDSNAWDQRYDLPNSPQNNNPWVYLAWAVKIITIADRTSPMKSYEFRNRVFEHARKCEIKPGLFNRWPDGSGGPMSQDELIGLSYLDSEAARRIVNYLEINDGYYINKPELNEVPETQNMYRFFWLKPYLKTCAEMPISLISQLLWCIDLIWDMIKTEKGTDDAGGRLLKWIQFEKMQKWTLCGFVIWLWCRRMDKLGVTPGEMLKLEPRENPVYSECAPKSWD